MCSAMSDVSPLIYNSKRKVSVHCQEKVSWKGSDIVLLLKAAGMKKNTNSIIFVRAIRSNAQCWSIQVNVNKNMHHWLLEPGLKELSHYCREMLYQQFLGRQGYLIVMMQKKWNSSNSGHWKDGLLAEIWARMSRSCRFLLFLHHNYQVSLTFFRTVHWASFSIPELDIYQHLVSFHKVLLFHFCPSCHRIWHLNISQSLPEDRRIQASGVLGYHGSCVYDLKDNKPRNCFTCIF